MKKIALLLALILAIGAPGFAAGMPQTPSYLEGVVADIQDDVNILVRSETLGEVLVKTDADTVWETTLPVEIGHYIYVEYNGAMTKSIPSQITADAIRSFVIEGSITQVEEAQNALWIVTADGEDVIVNLPESMKGQTVKGNYARVFFDGSMALSLPGQVGANLVDSFFAERGKIVSVQNGEMLLDCENGQVLVRYEEAQLPIGAEPGVTVLVRYDGVMSKSIPAQITAQAIELAA